MSELVVFPDLETALVGYLKARLSALSITATVASRVPKTRPTNMVRVSGLGGNRRNRITDDGSALFECWSADEVSASQLARTVRALIDDLDLEIGNGGAVTRGSSVPVLFPEPGVNEPRFQFTAQLYIYGEVLA